MEEAQLRALKHVTFHHFHHIKFRRNGRSPAEGIETLHYQDRQRFRHRRNGRSPAETMKWIGEILVLCYRNRECLFGIIRFYLDVFNTLILSAA